MPRRPVIVLAEDDALLRETMAEAMELEGYRVIPCESGYCALKAFFAEPCVDVLVLDWVLPDIEGPGLIRMLHAQRELAELPVVLTTGVELELPAFEGAVCLMRKPFAPGELSRLLRNLTHPGSCHDAPPPTARVA